MNSININKVSFHENNFTSNSFLKYLLHPQFHPFIIFHYHLLCFTMNLFIVSIIQTQNYHFQIPYNIINFIKIIQFYLENFL